MPWSRVGVANARRPRESAGGLRSLRSLRREVVGQIKGSLRG